MIDKHVTNLSLSKKLKAAGVKQESEFYWVKNDLDKWSIISFVELKNYYKDECYPAYLSSELGEMLPAIDFVGTQKNNDLEWEAIYIYTSEDEDSEDENTVYLREADKTEANSRAKMLIHLLDSNLIKAEGLK